MVSPTHYSFGLKFALGHAVAGNSNSECLWDAPYRSTEGELHCQWTRVIWDYFKWSIPTFHSHIWQWIPDYWSDRKQHDFTIDYCRRRCYFTLLFLYSSSIFRFCSKYPYLFDALQFHFSLVRCLVIKLLLHNHIVYLPAFVFVIASHTLRKFCRCVRRHYEHAADVGWHRWTWCSSSTLTTAVRHSVSATVAAVTP